MVKGGAMGETVDFTINGQHYQVNGSTPNVDDSYRLVDFIRDHANLKGTKVMCREGGCGACVVTVTRKDPVTGNDIVNGVNSCLVPVYSCQGWNISTVEALGNKDEGYDVIQNRLVNFHGTQCGFCTPGMVMSMNSLKETKKGKFTVEDVEKNFDGNICRCTGYRPILDAFKSMATDAPEALKKKCADIEDCASCPCPIRNKARATCESPEAKKNTVLQLANGSEWTTAVDLQTLFQGVKRAKAEGKKLRYVAGNTASGVYKHDGPYNAYIDITGIAELKQKTIETKQVTMGACVTLTDAISFLDEASHKPGFEYTKQISTHIERVANVPVRNNATLGGNLMIKNAHHEFPSDIFVLLEAAGATLTIASGVCKLSERVVMSPLNFLKLDMAGKLIVSISLPQRDSHYHFRSFKITKRHQNAHAYVNAGFLLKIENGKFLEQPRIVFGGIHANFVHATATEQFLVKNPDVSNHSLLQKALEVLEEEVTPEVNPSDASPEYRKSLTRNLLYKAILGTGTFKASDKVKSGGANISRGVSQGTQIFDTVKSDSPLYKPIPKLEGAWQAAGEAQYTLDIPSTPNELFGAFVLSTVGIATVKSMDPSEALAMPGVVHFITAKDIKGKNHFMRFYFLPVLAEEPVFADGKVDHYGQALGLIVARTQNQAMAAVNKVKVEYENISKPIVDVSDAVQQAEKSGAMAKQFIGTFSTKNEGQVDVKHTVKGKLITGSQYHFYMETISCLCIPNENGIEVHMPTQWMDHTQNAISDVLGIRCSSINVQVKRIGGGFGGKITRQNQIACAAAVAATTLRQPVRIVLDLETNMKLIGKRCPYFMRYEAGFDNNGQVGSFKLDMISDGGATANEATAFIALFHIQNVYKAIGWDVKPGFVMTNTPTNCAVRAPGSIQAVGLIENVMEHIAYTLKKDPLEVRRTNLLQNGDKLLPTFFGDAPFEGNNLIPQMMNELIESSDYKNRKILADTFNRENRWKKRGLAMVPVRYPIGYEFGSNLTAMIAIYHYDGTVACTHAGIEMGQGLCTKVMQTIAQVLNIPTDKIKLHPSNNFVGANALASGGSIASESSCFAVMRACEIIKERLKPVLEKMENPKWEDLIAEANRQKIDLTASYTPGPRDNLKGYDVYAIAAMEVEIDVLTGEYKMVRADIIEDAGHSLSPGVDIGQIEGGFVFGLGLWTLEKIIYCKETGKLLTANTWDYKPPETRDIPEDIKITLLRNNPNPNGILRSKATGEPILDAAVAVYFALKYAIASARADKGHTEWFEIAAPLTVEDVQRYCLVTPEDLVY